MEEDQLLTQLSSQESADIQKALLSLHEKIAKNNGVLVMQNLGKLKSCFLKIFENLHSYSETKIITLMFEFLSNFLANNYGSDYQIQFTSYILPEIIKFCLSAKGDELDVAEEALEAYIRSHTQLGTVLDYIVTFILDSSEIELVISGIKLCTKNIEYHPKIISADSRPFITFIEKLCKLQSHSDTVLAGESRTVLMNFLKRFPATMKEVANEMESRDNDELSKLIKLRNEAMEYKKSKKRRSSK